MVKVGGALVGRRGLRWYGIDFEYIGSAYDVPDDAKTAENISSAYWRCEPYLISDSGEYMREELHVIEVDGLVGSRDEFTLLFGLYIIFICTLYNGFPAQRTTFSSSTFDTSTNPSWLLNKSIFPPSAPPNSNSSMQSSSLKFPRLRL